MKALFVDIETSPILADVWGLWENNVGLNQIVKDWHLLSWSAKWLGDPASKIMYADQRTAKNIEDDSKILSKLWVLMDEADIIITQNGKKFDVKKMNARFIYHGFPPPSSFKQIDTCEIAKKRFGFTSNKLEYMTDKLCTKYKKLKHKKFPGHEMWTECIKGNLAAWKEMEKYNKHDVLSLEELYKRLIPWDNSVNFNVYSDDEVTKCSCGSTQFQRNGFFYSAIGRYQRYRCSKCGAEMRDRNNDFSKSKKKSLRTVTKKS